MGIDYGTKDEVRRLALEFRSKHQALDWSANIDVLIGRRGFDQGSYGSTWSAFRDQFRRFTTDVAKKVLALVSMKEGVILVSTELHDAKRAFAKAHELGHSVIPWHKDILYVCDESDLSPGTRAQMEFEANVFAAEVLLPEPLLKAIYAESPTEMETVLKLSALSGASVDASASAYVESHPEKCALLWLEEEADESGAGRLVLRRKRLSRQAVRSVLGQMTTGQTFSHAHVLWQQSRTRYVAQNARLRFANDPLKRTFRVSLFNNGYRVLALIVDESP